MDKWEMQQFAFKVLAQNEIRGQWLRWKRNFQYVVAASGEKDQTKLKFLLLAKAGPDVQEVFQSIPDADVVESDNINPYEVALGKLDEYFAPKHHDSMERNIFWTLKPETGENLEKFMLRAREQAYKCNFGETQQNSRDICVIDKIILMAPPDLKEKLLQKDNMSLDDAFKIVSSHQSVKYQASQMVTPGPSSMTSFSNAGGSVNRMYGDQPGRVGLECSRCGRKGHLGNDPKCPARDKECGYCKRIGHFAKKCKTASAKTSRFESQRSKPMKSGPQQNPQRGPQRIRVVPSEEVEEIDEGNPQSFIFSIGDGDEFIWLKLGGVMTQMLIDSGSRKNIIDGSTWDWLKSQNIAIRNATKSVDQKFRAYGTNSRSLDAIGMFDSTIEIPNGDHQARCDARFYVVRDGNQPLLGKDTAKELDVLRLGVPSDRNQIAQDFQEDHDVSEGVGRQDQPTTFEEPKRLGQDKEQPGPSERPKRMSRRPTKFDDYVVDDESSDP
nr:uncharacterized protein LOC109403417 [Aedes albopictus]XP_029732326.1 uncharacterized protein LOC109403417 [Aedes albopictus]